VGTVLVCAALNQQQEVYTTPRDKWFQLGLGLGGFLVADGEVPLLCRSPAFCIPLCSGGLPVSGDRGRQSLSCHSNGDSEHRGVIFGFFFLPFCQRKHFSKQFLLRIAPKEFMLAIYK